MNTRRDFLRTTAVAGSALVIGVIWDGKPFVLSGAPAPSPAQAFAPNAWIRIEPSGQILLTIGKSEMGQGVRTSLAMILADELDADWSQIEIVQASPGPNFKRLGTGGSWSIGGSWAPLRIAAASARFMLTDAAAKEWGVDVATCTTANGAVKHEPTRRFLPYGQLAAAASKLPVPEKAALKTVFKIIGTPRNRIDSPAIVTGKAVYGIDAHVPGMLYASIERGKVKSFDAAAAKRVNGVVDVVAISPHPRSADPLPASGERVLEERVRGATGIAVVAKNTWAAMKGRGALVAEWDIASTFNSADHMKALHAVDKGVSTRTEGTIGDLKGIEATYEYPFNVHAPVEPMNCVAHVHDGRCELWAPTQAPNRVQDKVAAALGMKPDDVRVNVTLIGGGFGRRLNADFAIEAALLSKTIAKPVQVLWTREDDMHHGHFQPAAVHKMWGAIDDAGKPVAWRHLKVSSPHNLSGPPTPEELKDLVGFSQGLSWGVYDIPYAIPNLETSYARVEVPTWIGPWRAVFAPSSIFARECFVDEVAHAAKKDPLEFRLAMLDDAVVTAGELKIDRARLRNVLKLVAEKSGWGSPLPAGRARGIACNVYDGDTHTAYVAEVSGSPFKVHRIVAAIDCGVVVNPRGIAQQAESGAIWALSNLMNEITFENGRAQQHSYADFPVLRMSDTPVIETHIVPSHGNQPFGIGEPTVPPVIPAVLNSLFAVTGKRIRGLPMRLDA